MSSIAASLVESLARLESHSRPLVTRIPPRLATFAFSAGRRRFQWLFERAVPEPRPISEHLSRTLWGIQFRSPLLNAAGMFKSGRGYYLAAAQGAGGFLAGTATPHPRKGNRRRWARTPFAPYPRSAAASNWLGLPNPGYATVASQLETIQRVPGCPVGVSLTGDPAALVRGLALFESAGVDFVEINESCPNTDEPRLGVEELAPRLDWIRSQFLARRERSLPVVVKFSTDIDLEQVPFLVDLLVDLGFDGVNFGNTSTDYEAHRDAIVPEELRLFDDFTEVFGGGISGRPLKEWSLALAKSAMERLRAFPPGHEFHVLRTGGIEWANDLEESEAVGIPLNQWYTGYFDAFSEEGHDIYLRLYDDLPAEAPLG